MRPRPPLKDNDQAYKDDVATELAFRPLYRRQDTVQTAKRSLCVVAGEEVARFAASWVGWPTRQSRMVTRTSTASGDRALAMRPGKPLFEALSHAAKPSERADSRAALAAACRSPERRILDADRSNHNRMERLCHHGVSEGRPAHGLRQDPGSAERAALSLQGVAPYRFAFGLKPDELRSCRLACGASGGLETQSAVIGRSRGECDGAIQ